VKGKPERDGLPGRRGGVRAVVGGRHGPSGGSLLIGVVLLAALGSFLVLRGADWRVTELADEASRDPVNGPHGDRADVARRSVVGDRSVSPAERKPVFERRRGSIARRPPAPAAAANASGEEDEGAEMKERRQIDAGEYIAALRESGETAGLAAFAPPGTRPPRSGVVVPPDYRLPEGFARHYQTTDDGRQLEPVLVVAPGYEIVDDDGEPVALTDDRIVPPEYAPADLPVQMLEIPPGPQAGDNPR
jgi:hypothetical protein